MVLYSLSFVLTIMTIVVLIKQHVTTRKHVLHMFGLPSHLGIISVDVIAMIIPLILWIVVFIVIDRQTGMAKIKLW